MSEEVTQAENGTGQSRSRRSGGREARRAVRAAPLSDELKPVRAGLEGGTYRPLGDADVLRIHEAALDLLERLGFGNAPASTVTSPPASVKTGTRIGDSHQFTGGTEFEVIPRSRNWMFEMSAVAAIRLRTLTCEAPPKMIPLRLMM